MSVARPKAAIYLRVSSHRQSEEDRYSLPTQEEACRRYAAEHGLEVVGVYTDVATGSIYRGRPRLSELRRLVRDRAIDVVIVHSLDRLSRDQVHLAVLLEEFREHGVQLCSVLDPVEDSPVGRFLALARAFAAEVEREKLAERTQRGRRARAVSGKPIIGPKAPYGLQWVEEEGRFVEVPEEAAIVRYIFERAAAGATIEKLMRELNERGVPSPMGKSRWSRSTIRYLLREERYTGKGASYRYKTERRDNGKWYRTAVPDDWTVPLPDGVYPQIVSPELFVAVQERARQNQQMAPRASKQPELFLLRGGFARCGLCGGVLTTTTRRCRDKYRAYYYCYRTRDGQCVSNWISRDALDSAVWQQLVRAIEREDVLVSALEQALNERASNEDELRLLERAIQQTMEQEQNLVYNLAQIRDERVVQLVVREIERLQSQREKLERERAELERQRELQRAWRERLLDVTRWIHALRGRLDTLDYEERRNLLTALKVRVNVYPRGSVPRIVVEASIPLDDDDCAQHDKHCCGHREAGLEPRAGTARS